MRMAGSNARRPAFALRDGRRVVSIGLTAPHKSCARSRRAQPFRTISTDAERTYRAARTACARIAACPRDARAGRLTSRYTSDTIVAPRSRRAS
ncbi:conserved hypothetical protein [Burkholderia pseudomallei MSHR346]|nr:conserved hypothetical protein [Burkholderia pseudomallei MSHR346]